MITPSDPAFPIYTDYMFIRGLTKREHLAALAMQGLVAFRGPFPATTVDLSVMAVQCADALIAELNRTEGQL